MSTKNRQVIWGGQIMGAMIRARQAREDARKAAREADRAEVHGMVLADGRLWRTRAAKPNNRPMPERRLRLAGDRMLSMQDTSELAFGCDPKGA
jgi:hypothetical protein